MNPSMFLATLLASILALAGSTPAVAQIDPASLAKQDVAAESRGDVAAALALYSDDAIVQNGGLCWTACVGKAAVQKDSSVAWRLGTTPPSSARMCRATSRWSKPRYDLARSTNRGRCKVPDGAPAWIESSY